MTLSSSLFLPASAMYIIMYMYEAMSCVFIWYPCTYSIFHWFDLLLFLLFPILLLSESVSTRWHRELALSVCCKLYDTVILQPPAARVMQYITVYMSVVKFVFYGIFIFLFKFIICVSFISCLSDYFIILSMCQNSSIYMHIPMLVVTL